MKVCFYTPLPLFEWLSQDTLKKKRRLSIVINRILFWFNFRFKKLYLYKLFKRKYLVLNVPMRQNFLYLEVQELNGSIEIFGI